MKKVWFMLAMMVCIFASCSDGGGEEPITPTPKPEEVKTEITIDSGIISNGLSFSSAEGEQSVSFSVNADWTLSIASTTSGTTWCKASATSGSKGTANVKFTVSENTDYEDRSVSVTIKAGTVSKTFTITQKGADALLVTTTKYEVAQEGGQIEIEVKANIDYKMEISEEAKEWIKESSSRTLTTYKHKLDIVMNEDAEKREGEITFKSGDKVETVKVYQAGGAILLFSQNDYNVTDKGDTITVDIKSNIDFGVQMPDVDWIIDEASSRGLSSHTLKYIVSANEGYDSRSAEIIFYDKNSDLKDTLKVAQAQKDAILVAKNEYTIDAAGGDLKFEINSNVDFEVSASVDWIKQNTGSRGLEIKPLSFTIAENTADEVREGLITVSSREIKQEIKVVQKAKSVFTLSETEFNITSEGGEFKIEVSTNGEYTITMPKADWLKESESRATSTYTHTFTVSANENYDAREAEIAFIHKEMNEVVKVKIVQAQKDAIIIAKNEYTIDASSSTLDFEVNTNVDFKVETSVDWIKQITESRGLEAIPLSFTIAENTANEAREGLIIISSGELKQEIKVLQKSKSVFSVSKTEFNITSEGGEFNVEVSTNGEYTITMPKVDWLTENESRATSTYTHTFIVSANGTYDVREAEIVFTHKETNEAIIVKVLQAQKDTIILSQKEYNVSDEGEVISVDVKSNIEFDVKMPDVGWITNRTSSRGLSNHTLKYIIWPNVEYDSRSANIIFFDKNSNLSDTLKINQAQKNGIILLKNEYDIDAEGGAICLEVIVNTDYKMEISEAAKSWITESTSRALTEYEHIINVANNEEREKREGEIYFKSIDGKISEKIIIRQREKIPYLTFAAPVKQTFSMNRAIKTLEYSVNNSSWKTLGHTRVEFGGKLGELRLRGKSSFGTFDNVYFASISFEKEIPVYCSGDIRTLVDYERYRTVSTKNVRFRGLFANCTELITPPELPATVLADYCYYEMFSGCTNLAKVPELPAAVMEYYCYARMFEGCTSLTEVPELPAVTLDEYCYAYMFKDCKNLQEGQNILPAMALESHCYMEMFSGCSSLTEVPKLPANILNSACYSGMFAGCTDLEKVPELPATQLLDYCYQGMFYNCTSLTEAPELPAKVLASNCYRSMFQNCTNLVNAPVLQASTLESGCYLSMFQDCKNLKNVVMLATSIKGANSLDNWMLGVSSIGIFTKAKSMNSLSKGANGIPNGWTIKNYGEE